MLCEGLSQSVGFVSDAYWEVFSSEGSCDFAVQSVRDERDFVRYSHSVFWDWGSRGRFWGRLLSSMASSGYRLRRIMSSNSRSCLSDVAWVEHFCCIRLRSLRMKWIFEFLGRADWWCTNSGFFAGFF